MSARLLDRTPLYAQVAQEILAGIDRGEHAVGSLLPTELELCSAFNVSRVTIRGALRELEMRGIISRQAGVGTRVERKTPRERFIHESSSVQDVLQFTQELTFRHGTSTLITLDAVLAHMIGAHVSAQFLRIEGLRVAASGTPICHSTHYIPAEFQIEAEELDGQKGSLAALLAQRLGYEIDELDQTIDAVNLDKAEAHRLAVKENDAALATWRRYRAEGGLLIVATRSLFPKDRYSYSLRNRRDKSIIERPRLPRLVGKRG